MFTIDPSFRRMRRVATGLLLLMVVLYAVARTYENTHEWWPWLRAFAEAGMVGALADWFAVTALFRHPLGLPIPHTAIIRTQQARIGASVGRFITESFLTHREVVRQWTHWKPVERLLTHLAEPEAAERYLTAAAKKLPDLLAGEQQGTAVQAVLGVLKRIPAGPSVAGLLEGLASHPDRRGLIAPVIARLADGVEANKDWIVDVAVASTTTKGGKALDAFGKAAAAMMTGKAVEKLHEQLAAAAASTDHPIYEKLEDALWKWQRELATGGSKKLEALKEQLLAHPGTTKTIATLLESVVQSLGREPEGLQDWSTSLAIFADGLKKDGSRLVKLEERSGEVVANLVDRSGDAIEDFIARTVEGWEADELSARLENQVGADLQFIRINGTLIGGAVGVLLHLISSWIWH